MIEMTVAELIAALQKMQPDAKIGAVPSWGCTILRARMHGKTVEDLEIPTDPDVWGR